MSNSFHVTISRKWKEDKCGLGSHALACRGGGILCMYVACTLHVRCICTPCDSLLLLRSRKSDEFARPKAWLNIYGYQSGAETADNDSTCRETDGTSSGFNPSLQQQHEEMMLSLSCMCLVDTDVSAMSWWTLPGLSSLGPSRPSTTHDRGFKNQGFSKYRAPRQPYYSISQIRWLEPLGKRDSFHHSAARQGSQSRPRTGTRPPSR
ncbi:hypothetical protein QBC46DRAFT_132470 [Diplogelasinospora grovesii]|uniref:Uncharacterized protein n=1 Tax=Diplogelasinospora grovesii TaxID=303347 RepID=A0AAN6NHV6_9PEZI|nr:hypothetical protein QBC46DRAFT_132470 [Diplogelasinospora grovesii]